MILLPQAKGKTYGVVGLGKSGRATVASLIASGANVIAWDDGEASRNVTHNEFPEVKMHPIADWDFTTIASLVMSPGIFLTHPAVVAAKKHKVEVIGDIELLYRAQPEATYIGITGTNGKSTTTSLIAHILNACGKRVEMGGNIGVPALALAPLGKGEFYVIELSSYQLDLVASVRINTAILLNISPDHLDHHGSMKAYVDAKLHIFDRQTEMDEAIVGIDDAESEAIANRMAAKKHQRVIRVSVKQRINNGVEVDDAELRPRFMGGDRANLKPIRALQGEHNWQNAAAAYAACAVNGCAHKDIIAAMKTYPGLPHRMQWLGEVNGVAYVNDSKATNADAAEKALKTYDNMYWIAGGVAKEGGIAPLAKYFPKIRHAYLIGEAADDFAKTLEGKVPYTISGTLENAFSAATSDAKKSASTGSVVLAPACASFDQFANFEVRGDAFMKLFEELKRGGVNGAAAAR